MMSEEQVREEITKLEASKMSLFAQLKQVEGCLAAMQAVLDPENVTPAEGEAE